MREPFDPNYSIENYGQIYSLITGELLKMLKELDIKDPKTNNHLELIKKIKTIDFDKLI